MITKDGFPCALLKQSDEDRIQYFEKKTIAHNSIKKTHTRLTRLMTMPKRPDLILLIGPTGVGKSTVRDKIIEETLGRNIKAMEKDAGFLPIAYIELKASEGEKFNWPLFYDDALTALNEPQYFIERKVVLEDNQKRKNLLAKRKGFENALKYRKAQFFIIDEAHHLIRGGSGKVLENRLTCLKSLAMNSKTTFILVGTYELRLLRLLNEELSRRCVDVHFKRYSLEKSELMGFKGVIKTFQKHIPFEKEPKLLDHWEFLYERSIGCAGILKDWLVRSYSLALAEKEKTITLENLKENALKEDAVLKMLGSATEGERALDHSKNSAQLRILLGLEGAEMESSEAESKNGLSSSPKPKNEAFQRVPKRDPVGFRFEV